MPGRMSAESPLMHEDVLRRLARAREAMHDGLAEALRLDALARTAGLSGKHFGRLFERAYGETPGRFLARLRIGRAKELLARGASVTEACMAVGFSSLGSFSTKFSGATGCSPREFQRGLRALGSVPARLVALYVPLCFLGHVPPLVLGPHTRQAAQNVRFEEVGARRQR
jgi:AraC-like DNA-binding protein